MILEFVYNENVENMEHEFFIRQSKTDSMSRRQKIYSAQVDKSFPVVKMLAILLLAKSSRGLIQGEFNACQ
jgi:hypothetical protein